MAVKTFSAAAVLFAVVSSSAIAAAIEAPAAPAVFIYSHNASASFLSFDFQLRTSMVDDGLSAPVMESDVADDTALPSIVSSTTPDSTDTPLPNVDRSPLPAGAPRDGVGSTVVGPVPLPPALPMFAASLLVLGGLGYGLRRRTVQRLS